MMVCSNKFDVNYLVIHRAMRGPVPGKE